MNQHTLSRTYLKGFIDPSIPAGKTPYAWTFETGDPKWRRTYMKYLMAKSDYYTLPELGKQKLVIEKYLQKMETGFGLAMQHAVTKRKPLKAPDRARLSEYMATSIVRTPAQHARVLERLQEPFRAYLRERLDYLKANPREFERLKANHEATTGKPVTFGLEDIDPKKFKVDVGHRYMMGTMLEAVPPLARTLDRMAWIIYRTSPSAPFVTSDFPTCLDLPVDSQPPNGAWRTGLDQPEATFSFPLSREYALFALWSRPGSSYKTARASTVRLINLRSCTYARETVIAPNTSFPAARLIVKRLAMRIEDRPG